jgi:hypothetical protein
MTFAERKELLEKTVEELGRLSADLACDHRIDKNLVSCVREATQALREIHGAVSRLAITHNPKF